MLLDPGDQHNIARQTSWRAWDILKPLDGAAFRVYGAGEDICNGYYEQAGLYIGRPMYRKVGSSTPRGTGQVVILKLGDTWHIQDPNRGWMYNAESSAETVPTSGWVIGTKLPKAGGGQFSGPVPQIDLQSSAGASTISRI